MLKILFMPYDPQLDSINYARHEYGSGGRDEKNSKVIQFEQGQGHAAGEIWWDPNSKPLSNITARNVQIVIRGHGMPGFRSIEGARGGERVTYQTVGDRLISAGLPKAFPGEIVCFCCHSAESGAPGTDPEIGDGRPFGRNLCDYMKKKGFGAASYYGFLGAVDSFAKHGSSGMDYYARGFHGGKMYQELGTMQMARVGFR